MATTVSITNRFSNSDKVVRFEAFTNPHVPSWRSFSENGWAILRADGHKEARWVSLSLSEHHQGARGVVTKETMLTLDESTARQLRDYLNVVLGA